MPLRILKLPRTDIIELFRHLTEAARHTTGQPKLTYAIARSLDKLKREVEATQKACAPPAAFEPARLALCERHARKNDAGEPMKTNAGNAFDIADMAAFRADLDALKADHNMAEHQDRTTAFLEDTTEVPYYPLPVTEDNIPAAWTPELLSQLLPIVADPDPVPAPASEAKPAPPTLTLVPKP